MYDLIIIGGGPAAITAGIYAARQKIKTLLITETFGGQANDAWQIDNYPGLPGLTGLKLTKKFTEHLRKSEIEIKEGIKVQKLEKKEKTFKVITDQDRFESKTIIVATGKRPKKLPAKNIDKFEKKGVSYCATCDAPLFKDKTVAVAGGGDYGINTAEQLLQHAKKIYVIELLKELAATDSVSLDKIRSSDKIEIITETEIIEVGGENFLKKLTLKDLKTGQVKKLSVEGLFVAIGSIPNSQIVKDLVKLNEVGEIVIDQKTNATSTPGIFAAGDVTDVPHKQIVVAAGEGAKATLGVYEYLKAYESTKNIRKYEKWLCW